MNKQVQNDIKPSKIDELDKQLIFEQIDSELIINDHNTLIRTKQWTRSNYKFVIFLDLCAIITAFIGGIILYNIFREQSIRLVVGQGAVRTLELTLLEQLDKQREIDLQNTKSELNATREELQRAERELKLAKIRFREEALNKLKEQQRLLDIRLAKALQGKSAQEQAEIRKKFELERNKIQEQIETERKAKEQLYQEKFDQLEKKNKIIEMTLKSQLKDDQKNATISKKKLMTKIQQQNKIITEKAPIIQLSQNVLVNQEIALSFSKIQNFLLNSQYRDIENSLNNIENIYKKTPDEALYSIKKKGDLFLVSLIRKYIAQITNITDIEPQVEIAQNNELILLINLLNKKTPNENKINKQMQQLKLTSPIIIKFLDSYIKYQETANDPQIDLLLKKAYNNIKKEKYKLAIENYQTILRLYPSASKRNNILKEFYHTIKLELEKNQVLVSQNPVNSKIPTILQQKALNILKNPRYAIPESKIIYMNSPDGYIMDIIDDVAIIALTSHASIKKGSVLNIFRVMNVDILTMDKLGTVKVLKKTRGNTVQATIKGNNVRIGDLIYLLKK